MATRGKGSPVKFVDGKMGTDESTLGVLFLNVTTRITAQGDQKYVKGFCIIAGVLRRAVILTEVAKGAKARFKRMGCMLMRLCWSLNNR